MNIHLIQFSDFFKRKKHVQPSDAFRVPNTPYITAFSTGELPDLMCWIEGPLCSEEKGARRKGERREQKQKKMSVDCEF